MIGSEDAPLPSVPSFRSAGGRGFVLVMTLWVIAIVGLVAAAVNAWVETAVRNAQALQDKAAADLAFSDITSELVYLMASRQMSNRGLEIGAKVDSAFVNPAAAAGFVAVTETDQYIAFDGRTYAVESNPRYAVTLQDGRGLVNLNNSTVLFVRRLLAQYNVSEAVQNRLTDTLQDYIDQDDLTRLSGAEQSDYTRLGLPGPANGPLRTPFEAQSILDWDMVPGLWKADMQAPVLTSCRTTGFNPNTATEAALYTYVPGLTPESARDVLARRAQRPFRNAREFAAAAGVLPAGESFFYSFTPGQCVVVDLIDRVSSERRRFSLSLNPRTSTQPWRIDYAFKVPANYHRALEPLDPEVVFPTPETVDLRERGIGRVAGVR